MFICDEFSRLGRRSSEQNSEQNGKIVKKHSNVQTPTLAVLTQPDLSSGTTTEMSTQHKQATLVTGSCTVNGIDQSYTELSEIALEPYQARVELDASRFTHELDYAACPICRLLPDAAIESRCCRQLFCLPCIWHWLNGATTCPSCRAHMSTSLLVAPRPFAA